MTDLASHFADHLNFDYDDASTGSSDGDEMPAIVVAEIERRERARGEDGLSAAGPPSKEAVDALRRHFLSGNADFFYGGFVDCMEKLGARPSAEDPLVYEEEHNLWYLGPPGGDTPEWRERQEREHEARVRLLRYGELIERQASRGIFPEDGWMMSYIDGELEYQGSDIENNEADEDDLTKDQLLAFANSFTMGYYYYANLDNVIKGLGSGVQTRSKGDLPAMPNLTEGLSSLIQIEFSEGTLYSQCVELETRYEELQRPLRPERVLNATEPAILAKKKKGKKGKKNRGRRESCTAKGSGWKSHSEEITARLATLLGTIDEHFLPSHATACIVAQISNVIASAATYDPVVAKALVDDGGSNCGSLVVKLRSRALEHAQKGTSTQWWMAYDNLTRVLGCSVRSLFKERTRAASPEELDVGDDSPACAFFVEKVVPALYPSMESSLAEERGPALENFERASFCAPHSLVLRLVSRKKEVWASIVGACYKGLNECKLTTADAILASRQNYAQHVALINAVMLIDALCMRALTMEESTSTVSPTDLAVKMVKRGVVPLLMDVAKADIGRPSNKAMDGLASISRVKDCRTIILQDSGGMELLQKALSSADAAIISPALLLISHLMWDEEWWAKISSIEPGVVPMAIRWALFAMKKIRTRAEERRKDHDKLMEKWTSLTIKAFHLDDVDEKDKVEQSAKEEQRKLELARENNWLNLENEANRAAIDFLLGRCLLVLSTVCKLDGGSDQLIEANGLSLFSACLDSPIVDIQMASIGGLHNTIACKGIEFLKPDIFLDPAHLVRSLVSGMHRLVTSGNLTNRTQIFTTIVILLKSEPDWRPYFNCLPMLHQKIVEHCTGHVRVAPRDRSVPKNLQVVFNEKCSQYTGKLRTCNGCGKLETKRGAMSKCSKCEQVVYCSKECQISHWHKEHKLECKKLRNSAARAYKASCNYP